MSSANPGWGSPRIVGELAKLGIHVAKAAVEKYKIRPKKPPSPSWRAFLNNHVKDLVSVDFFVVPTVTFGILFVFVVLVHARRRIVHFSVTEHPTAQGTAQQLSEALPWETTPRYLIRDRDRAYGSAFRTRGASTSTTTFATSSRTAKATQTPTKTEGARWTGPCQRWKPTFMRGARIANVPASTGMVVAPRVSVARPARDRPRRAPPGVRSGCASTSASRAASSICWALPAPARRATAASRPSLLPSASACPCPRRQARAGWFVPTWKVRRFQVRPIHSFRPYLPPCEASGRAPPGRRSHRRAPPKARSHPATASGRRSKRWKTQEARRSMPG
jgi:hypothetical protein